MPFLVNKCTTLAYAKAIRMNTIVKVMFFILKNEGMYEVWVLEYSDVSIVVSNQNHKNVNKLQL
jgi:hypothetical protein